MTNAASTTYVLTVTIVALMVLLFAIMYATLCIQRSNRRLAHRYEQLRDESISAWKTYLDSEHARMLSETAATVARVNAVARTLMRANMDDELIEAVLGKGVKP